MFAYQGHVAFFSFISELKDPRDFPKALAALQIFDISLYLTVSVVVYRYAGTDVASPALGSTSKLISRIAYGVALPTIVIAAVIYIHVSFAMPPIRAWRRVKLTGIHRLPQSTYTFVFSAEHGTYLRIHSSHWARGSGSLLLSA